jgi:hypothetical protein
LPATPTARSTSTWHRRPALFTDDDVTVLSFRRALVLTSIGSGCVDR